MIQQLAKGNSHPLRAARRGADQRELSPLHEALDVDRSELTPLQLPPHDRAEDDGSSNTVPDRILHTLPRPQLHNGPGWLQAGLDQERVEVGTQGSPPGDSNKRDSRQAIE